MSNGTPIIIKKKKGHAHAHHGGAWKVAYADFVTAMMAFFMIMWIMGMSDEVRMNIQGYFNDPFGDLKGHPKSQQMLPLPGSPYTKLNKNTEQGSKSVKEEKRDQQELKNKLEVAVEKASVSASPADKLMLQGLEVLLTKEGVEINLVEKTGEAFFVPGSAVLRPQARAIIAKIAPVLSACGRAMIIDGHTDSQPYPGSGYDNWDLSTDRAAAVRRALKSGGVKDSQVLMVRGNADRKLRYPSQPYHFSNRRVTVLLPFAIAPQLLIGPQGAALDQKTQAVFRAPNGVGPKPVDLPGLKKRSYWSGQ